MKGSVEWVEDVMFEAESDSGHSLLLEGPAEQGGRNRGMRPMELILLGVGGCSSFDVVTILKRRDRKSLAVLLNWKQSGQMRCRVCLPA